MATPSTVNGMSRRFFHVCRPLFNTNEAFLTKIKRTTYLRTYPTTLVQTDGSTFTIRYHEPRQIVRLPLRFDDLSAEEKQVVLAKRRPKEQVKVEDKLCVEFDSKKYLKYMGNRKPTK